MFQRQTRFTALAAVALGLAAASAAHSSRADQRGDVPPLDAWLGKPPIPPPMYNQGWKGCGEITALFLPVGGGTWETTYSRDLGTDDDEVSDGNYQAIMHGGLRAAGYFVPHRRVQLGAYAAADLGRMRYSIDVGGEEAADGRPVALDASVGLALKFGGILHRKLFVGVGVDFGLAIHHADVANEDVRPQLGAVGSPRMLFEFPLGDGDRAAVAFAFGLAASYVQGRALDSTDRITTRWLRLEPVLQLGVVFGG